jgi:predicted phage terminase large subunit-like protein
MTDNSRQSGLHVDETELPASSHLRIGSLATHDYSDAIRKIPLPRRTSERPLDTLSWGRTYLAAHFAKLPSAMHEWLNRELAEFHKRGRKLNLIGPRGAAKSTIGTLCYVLQSAVEGWEHYIWIVSDTKHQAQTHLENVKTELVDNLVIARDYQQAVGRGPRWQATAIELANGVVIESFGTGQRIRGRRRREHRPTLIVCDDLQNDSHISSAAQRESSRRWFHGTLLKAGTKETNVVNLATALHRDALALELHGSPGWISERFAAIEAWPENLELWEEWEEIYTRGAGSEEPGARKKNLQPVSLTPDSRLLTPSDAARAFYESHEQQMLAGARVLWPEVEDLYTLMRMRVESGRAAFDREKQGSPVDPELCEWPEDYFGEHIWFETWEGIEATSNRDCGFEIADCGLKGTNPQSEIRIPKSPLIIKTMALDPSKGGDGRRGDYSAFVMLGIDAAGVVYVEADLARRATPQMVADGAELCRRFQPLVFGVEANQFQELLAGEIAAEFERRQLAFVTPAAVHNHANKQMRIRRIGPYLSQRRLRFLAGSASTKLLVEQLRDFPAGAHDDGPDALEMALRLAEEIWHGRNADDGLGDRLIAE